MRTGRILIVSFLVPMLRVGCGRKGSPVVPVLVEPSPPVDLQAQVQRRVVILTWTRPATNVDGSALKMKSLDAFRISRRQQEQEASALSVIATDNMNQPANAVVSGNRYAFTD